MPARRLPISAKRFIYRFLQSSRADAIQKLEYIVSCYYQTGDFDLIIRISCHSSDELEEIHRQVMSLPGVDATRTHVVLKNVKNIYSAIRRPDK